MNFVLKKSTEFISIIFSTIYNRNGEPMSHVSQMDTRTQSVTRQFKYNS